jgi:2-keto-4-pentenoate hydratase/2-oxohepta-3-ene-1,7-dioic acid hydratase in catechol pathway
VKPASKQQDGGWSLVTVVSGEQTQVGIRRLGSEAVRVPDFLRGVPSVYEVTERWDALAPALRDHDPDIGELVERPQLLTPLRYPRKVLCSGPNFRDHLAEMGESGLGSAWSAYFFFKPPTTALTGPSDDILVSSSWREDRVDWEGELAVVIAQGGRDIALHDAMSHVAGYTVGNDISLRGPHRRDTPAAPFVWDWLASKGADCSLPLGPGMIPAWQVADPGDLRIRTLVNGAVKQDGTTADMVFDVAQLVAAASRLLTLEPGDVILTGTPAGVGAGRGEFLAPGDMVEVEIEGIGRIGNRIRLRQDA